jgi:hypothetical protein
MAGFKQLVGARGWSCDEAAVSERRGPGLGRDELGPAKLARTIEAEVIPRLLLAHRVPDGTDFAVLSPIWRGRGGGLRRARP